MSDYTIFVKDQAQVFLGGPPLVKMAAGEIVDSETLGGAEMHSTKSGLSDTLASDEFSGILTAGRWVRSINLRIVGISRQTTSSFGAKVRCRGFTWVGRNGYSKGTNADGRGNCSCCRC